VIVALVGVMLRYSRHALERLRARGISKAEVEAVLAAPDWTCPDRAGNPCYVRRVGARRIKVVIKESDARFVITVINLDE
jgi:hypothetical protein